MGQDSVCDDQSVNIGVVTVHDDKTVISPQPKTNKTNKTNKTRTNTRRRHTSIACANCSRWHVSCDSSRPCQRCVKKGLGDTCVDAPRKKSKYLIGVPDNVLPGLFRDKNSVYGPNRLFKSNAANSEYNKLSKISKPGSNTLQNMLAEPLRSNFFEQSSMGRPLSNNELSSNGTVISSLTNALYTRGTVTAPTTANNSPERTDIEGYNSFNKNNSDSNIVGSLQQTYLSRMRNSYSILLGPDSEQIVKSQINLMTQHIPLVPVDTNGVSSLDFKRLIPEDPSVKGTDLQKNTRINQYYLNNKTVTYPEVQTTYRRIVRNRFVSFAFECTSPEVVQLHSNSEWHHSLRFTTPAEIYSLINAPFSHTPGFHHLLMYLKSRFNQRDVVEMCRSIAEFRPIFIACSVTLTEEDMIFMEQIYQRTLLEYAKFIELSGTPTCVWRRNGQISYINEEFEILTGWKREELLNKMTFFVEILDDESVRNYFETFSNIAYRDFNGCEQMKICRILTPIKGQVINCSCLWTLKRDISGLPLMILANCMPIL